MKLFLGKYNTIGIFFYIIPSIAPASFILPTYYVNNIKAAGAIDGSCDVRMIMKD